MTANEQTMADEPTREFTMHLERDRAQNRITLDGQEIQREVSTVAIDAGFHLPYPVVTLTLVPRPDRPVVFDGLATVQIGEAPEPGDAAATFLAAIDAELLEETALNRLDLEPGPQGLTKAMLTQLIEWAQAKP